MIYEIDPLTVLVMSDDMTCEHFIDKGSVLEITLPFLLNSEYIPGNSVPLIQQLRIQCLYHQRRNIV